MRSLSTSRRRVVALLFGSICMSVPVGLAGGSTVVAAAAPVATAVDLGTLGGSSSFARDINDAGVVVGWSLREGDAATRAFRWTATWGMHGLGTLGGNNSDAKAVNELGQVVGWSQVPGGAEHAFIWEAGLGMRDLGTLGGPNSRAVAINDTGVVVGMADTPSGGSRAFVWDAAGGMRALDVPDGYRVTDINNAGQVVGSSMTAFIWDGTNGIRDLGVLTDDSSVAMAVNASGVVVGSGEDISGPNVAVLWSPAGVIRKLGTLPATGPWMAGCCTGALDVNDAGTVVGWGTVDGDSVSRAFVWDEVNGIRDLGTLGDDEATANAINNKGQIVGESSGPAGQHATLWTLVVDTTRPVVRCVTPTPTFLLRQTGPAVVVSATVTDTGSGPLAPVVSKVPDTSQVGRRKVALTGFDLAGNRASVACPYVVTYRTSGGFFRAPVDGNGVVNVARAGKTIPVRWRITDVNGVPVTGLTTAVVTAPKTTLPPSATSDPIEEYTTAVVGLTHKGNGVYQYNWKVPANFAGSKRLLTIDLGEGIMHTALFRLTS